MGQATDQALKDIEATKARIQRDISALTDSIPDGLAGAASDAASNVGPKALGGAGAVALAGLVARSAKKRSSGKKASDAERHAARVQAEELARAFGSVGVVAQGGPLSPPPPPDQDSSGGGAGKVSLVLVLAIAAGAAAAWFAGRR